MENKVYFVAGVYGVGKTTLCNKISKFLNIPAFSSSDLISEIVGEKYGSNKTVRDKELNQSVLINAVNHTLKNNNRILLSGHFCIYNNQGEIDKLPETVFEELHLAKIILLESAGGIILQHLTKRDNCSYKLHSILQLMETEKECALEISNKIKRPLIIHQMKFNNSDVELLIKFLNN